MFLPEQTAGANVAVIISL